MLSAISRRNAVLHCAASSNVRGGTKRVLVRPGIDALAITAIPQVGTAALSVSAKAVRMAPPTPAIIHTPANQLYPRSSQNPPGKRLVTNIAVIHFGFLKPSLVGMRSLSGYPYFGARVSSEILKVRNVCGCM